MKETKLTTEMLEVISSNNGLRQYLDGLSQSKDATPRSNLYNLEGKTRLLEPDAILAEWKVKLSGLEHGTNFEQEVYQFDLKQLEKWGPQGGRPPVSELLKDYVFPSFQPTTKFSLSSSPNWEMAKDRVRAMLWHAGAYKLQPVSYKRVVDDMRVRDTLESNSGWPLFTRRNKPEVIAQSILEAENGDWKTYPAIALFRNYNQKIRLVWMFPMSANLVEGAFFQPLQSVLMNSELAHDLLAPWTGFEEVRRIVGQAYAHDCCLAASDFSSTDAHFQLAATLEVFDVIQYCFQERYRAQLYESLVHMHKIPLIVSADTMLVGEHGVSSGSNWTNFIETIFDMILGEYVSLREAWRKNLLQSAIRHHNASNGDISNAIENEMCFLQGEEVYAAFYAIGDDMSWFVDKHHYDLKFAERLAKYGKQAGQEIKAEKTTNEPQYVKSLQRLFQQGYLREDGQIRAVYPTIRALKSLVYPERFHSPDVFNKDMEAVRAFMILENCIDHPLFTEFCKFVSAGDPNLQVVARKSRNELKRLTMQSKTVHGLTSTYNQEKRDQSLADMESVKCIASLS